MGLRASIYKRHRAGEPQTFANGGISDFHDEVTIVNIEAPFGATPGAPAVMLVHGHVPGDVIAVPVKLNLETAEYERLPGWGMFGGSYISDSDSRFGEKVREFTGNDLSRPVALHDRYE